MKIGIIGGTGLDNPDILKNCTEVDIVTRYGIPSSPLITGKINGTDVVLLSRHGRKHQIPPTFINNRANIIALKESGATHIIATCAAGSLREEIGIGDLVVPDQFIDFTRHRTVTFYEDFNDGMVHTPMAEPFDNKLRSAMISAATELGLRIHHTGTIITIEGNRFSTKSESNMFRIWGADIINMSITPEVILANEAVIPYACIAISTDYDCWRERESWVTWKKVLQVFEANLEKVKKLLIETIKKPEFFQ
jgi:5'-methylthioadenosine phosphorylase